MTNLFYKIPADLLQTNSFKEMMQDKGAISLFGLAILIYMKLQDSREKQISYSSANSYFCTIASRNQIKKVLESDFFTYDESTDSYRLSLDLPRVCTQPTAQPSAQATAQPSAQATAQPPKHYSEDLEIEGEDNTRETATTHSLILEIKNLDPTKGELWEGVLLCCPDRELRQMMVDHWPETMGYLEKHLEARSSEITDRKSLMDILRELVQPTSAVFCGLKLFLGQEVKSDAEKAFDKWLNNLTNILLMREPLTFKQFDELVQICHDPVRVKKKVERLNNYPFTPSRYVSAFQTVKDWIENPQ